MNRARTTWTFLAVAAAPVALAVAGLTHPHELTAATAPHWTTLHIVLIPIWGLLAVSVLVLLRREAGVLPWIARAAAFVYVGFYGALDAVNGIAVGTLVGRAPVGGAEAVAAQLRPLIQLGNTLAYVGSSAFLLSVLITVGLLVRRHGRPAWIGGGLTVLAAVSFIDSHIYWPRGVLTMLVLAGGFALLARLRAGAAGAAHEEGAPSH